MLYNPNYTYTSLYREYPKDIFVNFTNLPPSGSIPYDAGWKAEDNIPVSGSLLFGSGSLIDGDYATIVTPAVITNWSIGCNLGHSGSFRSFTMYDKGYYPEYYISGSNSSINVYVSYSNSNWVLWKTVFSPPRILYSGSIYATKIEFPEAIGSQFIKITCIDGPLKDLIGNLIRITEIEIKEENAGLFTSGSIYNSYGSTPTIPADSPKPEINFS